MENTGFNPEECKNYLIQEIEKHINIQTGDLIVYVSCGLPFLGGTLNDVYGNENGYKVKRYIYGVLTSPLANIDLNNNYHELCNINDETRKILLSPFSESSLPSLCNIGCLLGYQNHDGKHSELFERALNYTVHFAPLITSMRRVVERYNVTGRDVITITSTLFTFFRSMNPRRVKSSEVFESSLECSSILCGIDSIPENLPVTKVELSPGLDERMSFLNKIKQGRYAYIWEDDAGDDSEYAFVSKMSQEDFDSRSKEANYFTPIAPLSILVANGCSIVRGKEHNFLYVRQSSEKSVRSQNDVDIIDPTSGFADSKDVYQFSKEQEDPNGTGRMSVIDASEIRQIIMILVDESETMKGQLENVEGEKRNFDLCTNQYLTIFQNRLSGYRIPCIVGVTSFNEEATTRFSLSPFIPDMENGLKNIETKGTANFHRALSKAIDDLLNFTRRTNGDPIYENAVNRIVMITASSNFKADDEIIELTKKLVTSNIVLDSVVFGQEKDFKELITISHISGGLSFNVNTINEGLTLFEKSAFLDYNDRDVSHHNRPIIPGDRSTSPSKIRPEMIDSEFISTGTNHAEFNSEVRNKYIYRASINSRLSTPSRMVYMNRNNQIPNKRFRRILRELYYISHVMNEDSDEYDPDLKVLTYSTNLDNWIVFLKGTEGTIYAGKWYELFISFPDTYPSSPPIIRFMSIPYHLNISPEGRICLNIVEKGYMPACRVLNIIQEVKELFVIPNTDTPIQIEILETFLKDQQVYYDKAKKSAEEVGKENYEEFFPKRTYVQGLSDDEDETQIGLDYDQENTPLFMISQVYGGTIRDPVLASSGVFYEREELIQLVASSSNPTCVVTGRLLTEQPDDI